MTKEELLSRKVELLEELRDIDSQLGGFEELEEPREDPWNLQGLRDAMFPPGSMFGRRL